MNQQQQLYANLMRLVEINEAFYYVDHPLNSCIYRVFTYRLASYTDFLEPDALESRGHMFRLDLDGNMLELASWSLEKFFNYEENPMTMDLDLSDVKFIHEKRDGSLITTYDHEGKVCVKSKTALASDQALDANRILYGDPYLLTVATGFTLADNTVIMEYTSPENRIVLPYQTHELKILAVRDNHTGEYVDYDFLYSEYGDLMTRNHTDEFDLTDMEAGVQSIYDMKGIEGFVIGLGSGQRFKVKTAEYFALHRAKDSIQSDKRLFEVALNDATDDLRTMFHDDQYTLDRITKMEALVMPLYNHLVASTEAYHNDNKHLSQKDYAVKGQKVLDRVGFHLSMQLFNGKIPDYKGMIMRNHEEYL
jgi:T4 RnlA family RNA ligase